MRCLHQSFQVFGLRNVWPAATVLLFGFFAAACNPCGKGYDPRLMARSIQGNPSNNTGSWLQGDTILLQNDTAYFRIELRSDKMVRNRSFSLFPELLACEPVEPYLENPVDSLSILATSDWDAAHPNGSSLADLSSARMYLDVSGNFRDTSFHAFAVASKGNRFLLHEAQVCLLKTACRNLNKVNTFALRLKMRNGAILQSRNMTLVRV